MKNIKNAFSEVASEIQDKNVKTLERFVHDDENGLNYKLAGDYYLPCLKAPDSPKVGTFGKSHFHYLRTEKKLTFDGLLFSGKLNNYLEEIDRQAEEMFNRLVRQMKQGEGVTEKLKAKNQMLWVQKMNSIRNRATEIVNAELIYN